jgi:hypothetical protein
VRLLRLFLALADWQQTQLSNIKSINGMKRAIPSIPKSVYQVKLPCAGQVVNNVSQERVMDL